MTAVPFTKLALASALLFTLAAPAAQAGAIRSVAEFQDATLARNDDGSTGLVSMGFSIDFYGLNTSSLYVNNNGNVTFDSALGTYTPFALSTTSRQILAPFFADWDTRPTGFGITEYGTGTVDGRSAFGVNWIDIGYFSMGTDKRNSAQLIIVDRSDIGTGDFDFEFNFDQIQWETGGASGGSGGLGGSSARVGWSNGAANTFELTGSAVNGAFLDTNLTSGLIYNSLNSNVDGRYLFQVRNGAVVDPNPNPAPEPATMALLGLGLLGSRRYASARNLSVARLPANGDLRVAVFLWHIISTDWS